ncbi:MAG TPA: DUF3267 domain-containing protein [Phototrophicaceae bacterium]|nr:DUF3267 domain-containing protein [Phototrophicaceae bacterium]
MTPTRASLYDLPPGYGEIRRVLLTERRLLIWLNIIAIVPLILMIIWMAIWWGIASRGRATSGDLGIPWWLAVIIVFVIVLPLHELLHGITIRLLGYPVRYGANLSKGVLFATSDNALFWRNQYLAIALAPIVGMTVLAMLIMLFASQGIAYYVAIAAVLNAGGAVGDLWSVGIILRYPARVLIRDEAEGFRIYAAGTAAGSSTQKTDPPLSP